MRRLLTMSSAIFEDTRSEPTNFDYAHREMGTHHGTLVDTYADPSVSKRLRRTSKNPTMFNMINARSFHMIDTHTHSDRPMRENIIS